MSTECCATGWLAAFISICGMNGGICAHGRDTAATNGTRCVNDDIQRDISFFLSEEPSGTFFVGRTSLPTPLRSEMVFVQP